MNKCIERIVNGIVKENPTFVMLIGMCPTLAVTTSAINGIGMGLSTTLVLVFSNLLISLLRKIIPDSARVPAFIVVVASLVTIIYDGRYLQLDASAASEGSVSFSYEI